MTNLKLARVQNSLAVVPRTVSASGLVTIAYDASPSDGALLELDNGVVLRGVQITDSGGWDVTGNANYRETLLLVRVAAGDTATIAHNDGSVSAAHRIRVRGGASASVTDDVLYLLMYSSSEAVWVAYAVQPDMAGDISAAVDAAIATHEAASNPHPQYARVARYSGVTSGSGTYSVVFGAAYTNTPNVQASIVGGTSNQYARVTSRSTTGFTVTAYTRGSVNLLGVDVSLSSPTVTNGLTVDVLVASND